VVTYQHGLQESMFADAGGELLKRHLVERRAGIGEGCRWVNFVEGNVTKF
jgi:hypothetical protein